MAETIEDPEATKPKVLYHASPNRQLDVLEPRAESIRDEKEGPVVFAHPDKANVTRFLVPSNDSWTLKMRFNGINTHIISDRTKYEELDKGGAIYHLSPDSFELDTTYDGMKDEYTSKTPVVPVNKEVFESGLQAQLDNGVQVYFVDKDTFDRIKKANDRGRSIISKLESENKKLGINVQEIPSS